MKTLWFVSHGPDRSHMWDVDHFTRLKDAKKFASELPPAPTGLTRPYTIEKAKYMSSNIYGDTVKYEKVNT